MYPTGPHAVLRRFFAGLTESTFESRLGVADPPLVDYIVELLVRFARFEAIYAVRDPVGRRLTQVADMLEDAQTRIGEARREALRQVGDVTLFWTGVYPEALDKIQNPARKDHLLDYTQQGKQAYYIASCIPSSEHPEEGELLERLSREFELCAYGLHEVRREWERRDKDEDTPPSPPTILF